MTLLFFITLTGISPEFLGEHSMMAYNAKENEVKFGLMCIFTISDE